MRKVALLVMVALAGCKPPPTDADMARALPEAQPTFASDPLPSPDTEGAVWAPSPQQKGRIIYGIPGDPALIALDCVDETGALPMLRITRLAPADEGASALLALVGNGHIGRVAVEAREIGGRSVWEGETMAADLAWEPLSGPRQVTVTVPGAGMVTLNPGETAWGFVSACRDDLPPPVPLPQFTPEAMPEPTLPPIP